MMRHDALASRLSVCLILWLTCPLMALLHVDPPAGDAMMLQRGKPNTLRGQADPGATVRIIFRDVKLTVTADDKGRWSATLPAIHKPGGPDQLNLMCTDQVVTLANVMVGDIWICSGQSNMQWPVSKALNAYDEIAAANQPQMRLLAIDRTSSIQPLEQVHGTWQACTSQTAAEFSAVGYFFGRELVQQTYVPIGLVMVAWGGKAAEPFVQIQALLQEPDLVPYVQHAREKASTYEADLKYYHEHKLEILSTWKKEALAAKARGLRHRLKPQPPAAPDAAVWPQNIWNGMVHPLLKMPITGVIWYQGESNTNKPFVYRTLLKTLITDWRSQWQQGDFPFYIVQLANYKAPQSQPAEDSPWAMLRESQAVACALLRTGLAVAIDIGEADTIHPPNKQEVGRRLSLLALHDVYGMDVDFAGPTFERMMIHGQSAVLYFKHAQGLHTPDDQSVAGFAIAGENQKFHWAQGVIDGSTMVLTSKAVPKPVAVRYGWANNPKVNLYNQSGLPATPFRTDNWE